MGAVQRLRVVVVDADRDATDTLVWLLQMAGHEAIACYAGEEAIAQTCASSPDVMLIDMAMPRVDGNQVASRVRQHDRSKHAHLIAISSYADDAHRQQALHAGFDHYLIKPVEFPDLCGLLECGFSKAAR